VNCDVVDADCVSSNDNSAKMYCKQRCGTSVAHTSSSDMGNANGRSNLLTSTAAANDFELLDESLGQTFTHLSNSHRDKSSFDMQERNDRTVMTWQRSRSLIMAVLGVVIRLCFSSVFLSQLIQVTCYFCHFIVLLCWLFNVVLIITDFQCHSCSLVVTLLFNYFFQGWYIHPSLFSVCLSLC